MDNSNKTVLVTGASAGIGKATAKLMKQKGYNVYGCARRLERMDDLKQIGVHTIRMDLTDEPSMEQGLNQIMQNHGGIDILVNNAGYGACGAIEDVDLDEARRQFEVNVFGLARLTQLILPHMREQKYGKIINISSVGGKGYTPMNGWYHASKFAVEGLSDCLRNEVKPFGIDVIIIEPGAIKTEWHGLATEEMRKISGHTAYKKTAMAIAKLFDDYGSSPKSSKPKVIADVILKSVESKNPQTRYVAGYMGKTAIRLRRYMTDKMYDCMLRMLIKRAS
ncbi:SDR family NAD(P)-dependent oxidoreductase [Planctomycetota bacterium]|nr:SDR family NAD(P)-dependent oxidoreductase [Planctomycetota bacterium]